jgi:hypothetical protein
LREERREMTFREEKMMMRKALEIQKEITGKRTRYSRKMETRLSQAADAIADARWCGEFAADRPEKLARVSKVVKVYEKGGLLRIAGRGVPGITV